MSLLVFNRKRLFNMINEMPTVFEVVSEKKPIKDKSSAAESGSKAKGSTKVRLVRSTLHYLVNLEHCYFHICLEST